MFWLLQKRPRNFDISSKISQHSQPRLNQLVGGNVQATTFRPTRQYQQLVQRQDNVNYLQQQQSFYHLQQQPQVQRRIDQDVFQQRQAVPYTPFSAQQQQQQRQYQEQLAYDLYLRNRRLLEEQQLKAQLERQRNRFDLTSRN